MYYKTYGITRQMNTVKDTRRSNALNANDKQCLASNNLKNNM